MEGEVAGAEGSSIEALVDKELLELVFLSPACLNDCHLRILPLVCRYDRVANTTWAFRRWREVCKSEAVRRAMLAGIVFSFGGQQETSPLGHPLDVALARCSIPARIKAFQGTQVVSVAAGWHHSVFLTACGEVFACGNSTEGKLGQGEDNSSHHEPRKVVGLQDVAAIRVVAGAFHTLVLTSTGTLYSFGYGRNGRLGLGDDTNRSVATLITGLCGEEVVQMSGGNMHSLAVTKTGRAYAWGSGLYDMLGLPAVSEDVTTPTRIGGAFEAKRVVAASAGDFHSLFLTDDGQVFSCGRDSDGNGRLGYPVTAGQGEPRLIPALADKVATVIAAGEAHSLVATEDGCVFTFGLNARGQLGFEPDAQPQSPTQRLENLPTDISKCLCEGGKVTGLVAASQHSFVVMEDGSVYSFGCGDHFRLGHGTADAVITPKKIERLAPFAIQSVAANGRHTLALT